MGISNVASQPVGSNSLDNTLRIIDVRPSEWYLLDIEAGGIANGFGHGQLRIWDDQGNLQAIASQSVVVAIAGNADLGSRDAYIRKVPSRPT